MKNKLKNQIDNTKIMNIKKLIRHKFLYFMKELGTVSLAKMESLLGIKSPTVSILLYHSVSYDNTVVDVEPKNFEYQIKYIMRNFDIITLDQVIDYIQGKIILRKPSVALTFDDGYKDILHNVVPILKKYKIHATIFVLASPHNANRNELANNKKIVNFLEIKKLKNTGWTIGCHTATHPNLAKLDKTMLKKEIIGSKTILEKKIKSTINFFCYPKGIYNSKVLKVTKKANYKAAFTTEAGFIKQSSDLYKIPRIGIDGSITSNQFPFFLTSSSILYFSIKNKLQSLQILSR